MNTKVSEVDNKIQDVSGLVTTAVLNTKIKEVANKLPAIRGSIKKTGYNAKILDFEKNYFTTSNYNKFTKKTWCKGQRKK